jgi:putative phosphoribosyl transferase
VAAFTDRADAGRRLVGPVEVVLPRDRPVVVVGLPRGGVVVGAVLVEGLRALGRSARLDLIVVAKVRAPERPELALGAVTERATVRSEAAGQRTGVDDERFTELVAAARRRLGERAATLPASTLGPGAAALLVDDGLATGSTAEAAVAELRALGASWVGLAVPVTDSRAWQRVRRQVDAAVALLERHPMHAVSLDYRDFTQLADDEVLAALVRWR